MDSNSPSSNQSPSLDDVTQQFDRDGVVVLRSFFDVESEIHGIQESIFRIIQILLKKYDIASPNPSFHPTSFDSGYYRLIQQDRRIGGEVYDAVKQIPEFVRLCSNPKLSALFRKLRPAAMPGIAHGGSGIRIDNPSEDRYRANWHQDYTTQVRSTDGLVFWSPLVELTEAMGPVEFCLGSQQAGPLTVYDYDPKSPEKTGAYGITLADEAKQISLYEKIAPLTMPGDLVVIDYMTIHRSGSNQSARSRWSMQIRYFNFMEPSGVSHGWKSTADPSFSINSIHPGLLKSQGTS